jgi:Ser/Thr protein kinase RdoA (MazF antagonist)
VWQDGDRFCHMQDFIDGSTVGLNAAPDTLLAETARLLGRIHAALADYPALPTGIGEGFFKVMTPERAAQSYRYTLDIAREKGDDDIADDLLYRIRRMDRFPPAAFDLDRLTCCNTHGDYTIGQLICRGDRIRAVIDWTAACVHPAVWEILRSFLYASPACREGSVDVEGLVGYVREYLKHHDLTTCDLEMMPHLFHHQIAVCDYYGQYYGSDAANRGIFLHQARFSTRLMHWFEANADRLSERLTEI